MLLTEGCRVPVDDPNTHLELTMIHEAMVLDNSGVDLALLSYGAGMKMVVITSLIAALVVPKDWGFAASAFAWLGIESAAAVLIGTIESQTARLRMTHVPQFIFVMTSLALIILSAAALWMKGGLK
jgi:formate hydrogenlyase subunit 4